jgi:hypothetical protein
VKTLGFIAVLQKWAWGTVAAEFPANATPNPVRHCSPESYRSSRFIPSVLRPTILRLWMVVLPYGKRFCGAGDSFFLWAGY